MEIREDYIKTKGGVLKKVFKESPASFPNNKKYKLRKTINEQVFDLYDSVADNAKMISLLFVLISRIWEVLPDDIKNKLDSTTKQMIDYAIQKYHSIQTRADIEFELNGKELIDKLMDRQHQIGQLFKEIYKLDQTPGNP